MKTVVILGGAGFVGANLAHRLLLAGESVEVFDNLSRTGVERNVEWLREQHDGRLSVVVGDIRDEEALVKTLANASHVYHAAAQVGVAKSLTDPVHDSKSMCEGPSMSSKRCAGSMIPPLSTTPRPARCTVRSRTSPCSRARPGSIPWTPGCSPRVFGGVAARLYSPHGCSKGAADQYVLDYTRTFDLRAVVLRLSCVYGPRQYGNEDQGWIAHFVKRSLAGEPITIYGTGRQVRDALFRR